MLLLELITFTDNGPQEWGAEKITEGVQDKPTISLPIF
jgi:hypothetical protein